MKLTGDNLQSLKSKNRKSEFWSSQNRIVPAFAHKKMNPELYKSICFEHTEENLGIDVISNSKINYVICT